jgi:hypothetical protein
MKQTTEVSGNQTSKACSSVHVPAPVSHTSAPYKVYVRPHRIAQNFLAVLCRFWHSVFTRKICRQLQGYSEFDQYFVLLGPILSI